MPQLKLYLFGPPRLEYAGQPVEIGRRKAVAILCYLAVTARQGRPLHSRDALATLFWPDYDQSRARAALRRDLAALTASLPGQWLIANRETIGLRPGADSTSAPGSDPPHITVEPVWSDVDQFRALLAACRTHGHPRDAACPACLVPLTAAVNLYHDDFLAGFTLRDSPDFDDWQAFQTETMRQELAMALERLIQAHNAKGEYTPAIHYARRWLALDPWHEPAHCYLMELYAWSGQHAAALHQYDECARVLAEELGASPGEQTSVLYNAIRKNQHPPPPLLESTTTETTPTQSPLPQAPSFLEREQPIAVAPPVFVARARELAQLASHLDRARSGQGRVAFVIGEAGSGKTALVQAFAQRAQTAYPELLLADGICDAIAGVGDPYAPFREILGLLTGNVQARWAAGAISREQALTLWDRMPHVVQALMTDGPNLIDSFVHGAALIQCAETAAPHGVDWLMQLKQFVAQQQPNQSPANLAQRDLFAQYTNVVRAVAGQSPLLLILDDLQWADAGSIDLLFHLGRHLAGSRILVIGVYRPQEVAMGRPPTGYRSDSAVGMIERERHPLEPVVHELQRHFGARPIDLDHAEGRLFVQTLLDSELHGLSSDFQDTLYHHTGGHALFTVELLRGMQARGDLVQDELGRWIASPTLDWEMLPARVEGVIGERIGRLPATLQEALTIASVEGETFTAEVIARVQAVDELQMIKALSGILDRRHRLVGVHEIRRLGRDERRVSRYRFRHNLFQKYLYNRLDDAERVYLHAAVGRALEALYGAQTEELASALARHFQAAGLVAQAIDYLHTAGVAAARVYAHAEAIAYYRQALELAQPDEARGVEGRLTGEKLTHLYTNLGRALELDSQFEQALATYEELESVARRHDDPGMELAAVMGKLPLFAVPTPLYNPALGREMGEHALALARAAHDQAAEAKILWTLSISYMQSAQMSKAIEVGEQSLALARELGLAEQIALTLSDLGLFCYTANGQLQAAKASLQEATTIWRRLDNRPMIANNLSAIAVVWFEMGEHDQAIAAAQEALAISQSLHNLWGQAYSGFKAGSSHWEQGDPDRAIAVMQESIRMSELASFGVPQVETRADLAFIFGELGAIERGVATARLALTTAESQFPTDQTMKAYVLSILARLYLKQDRLAAAEAAINAGARDANWHAVRYYAVNPDLADAEIALSTGDGHQALTIIARLLSDLRTMGMRARIPRALLLQGEAWRHLGQPDAARNCWREARVEAEATGSRWMLWQILAALAQVEIDSVTAAQLRQQAQSIIAEIAAHVSDAELRASFLMLPAVLALENDP